MSRRPSPTARTTSSSGGRCTRRPRRAPRRSRSRTLSPRFFLSRSIFKKKLFQHPRELLWLRQHHAVEELLGAARDADGREVLDLELADLLGVVLDVEPCELHLREAPGEREKARPVFAADVAPFGAQA